jgi:SAM-dependent methyltransferase
MIRWWWSPLIRYRSLTLDALGPSAEGARILEIGAGTGHLATALAQQGASVVGVDISPAMVGYAHRRAKMLGLESQVRFEGCDFDVWSPLAGPRFDTIVALAVFDYCRDPDTWLAKMSESGNRLIATFPLQARWRQRLRPLAAHLTGGLAPTFYSHEGVLRTLDRIQFVVHRSETICSTLWIDACRRGAP